MLDNLDNPSGKDLVGKSNAGLKILLTTQVFNLVILMAGTNDLGHGSSAGVKNYLCVRFIDISPNCSNLLLGISRIIIDNLANIHGTSQTYLVKPHDCETR